MVDKSGRVAVQVGSSPKSAHPDIKRSSGHHHMSKKIILIAMSALVLALAALVFILSSGVDNSAAPAATATAEAKPTAAKKANQSSNQEVMPSPLSGESGRLVEPDSQVSTNEIDPDSREAILVKIQDAMATYSDEGVVVVEPLLFSPDLEIRESAIEAMKQIATPGAAKSLRRAANKPAISPMDKKNFLEAAEFIELPPYQFKKKQ